MNKYQNNLRVIGWICISYRSCVELLDGAHHSIDRWIAWNLFKNRENSFGTGELPHMPNWPMPYLALANLVEPQSVIKIASITRRETRSTIWNKCAAYIVNFSVTLALNQPTIDAFNWLTTFSQPALAQRHHTRREVLPNSDANQLGYELEELESITNKKLASLTSNRSNQSMKGVGKW